MGMPTTDIEELNRELTRIYIESIGDPKGDTSKVIQSCLDKIGILLRCSYNEND